MLSTYQKKSNLFTTFVAVLMALLLVLFVPATAHAENGQTESSTVRIHVLPFDHMDAIIVECDGHFGVVDSAEDSEAPDGSDFRYPVRPGTTYGQGKEDEVIAYMRAIGVKMCIRDRRDGALCPCLLLRGTRGCEEAHANR